MLFRLRSASYFATHFLILGSVLSCEPQSVKKDDQLVRQPTKDVELADQYFIEDVACVQGEASSALDTISTYIWQQDRTAAVNIRFVSPRGTSLRGSLISLTSFGFHQRTDCRAASSANCNATPQVVEKSKPLKLCRPKGPYARLAYEGVALTSLANIDQAYGFYSTLANRSSKMMTTRLLVLPTVETLSKKSGGEARELQTDNLAYAPSFGGEPTFVIYPKGSYAVKQGLWRNVNLWEIPWALAHEFGHHVLRTHTGIQSLSSSAALKGDGLLPIHGMTFSEDDDNDTPSFALIDRTVDASLIYNAVNEAFADLYAHYAGGSQIGSLRNLDCFGSNRDISVGVFTSGEVKALTQSVHDTFNSKVQGKSGTCQRPSFQDHHTIGAIIAYGLERLFVAEVSSMPAPEQNKKKAEILLSWADKMGTILNSQGATSNLNLGTLIEPAVALLAAGGALDKTQCQILSETFPMYASEWGRRYGCS